MHHRAFITFKKENAENSEEARNYVLDFLTDEGFCIGGFFCCPIADWFVIGGRWSGELQNISIHKKIMEMLNKPEGEYLYSSDLEDEGNQIKIQKLWEKEGGKGINAYKRDQYENLGYDDDAMIVTEKIYNDFLKENEGTETNGESFWDLDYEEVNKDFINNKWIVVVDYHN
uniref:Uncharacterized protein n=1 Tax=viral metagenome TaxID=1070528 RepID=A0A6M3LVC4_9ZZZZ